MHYARNLRRVHSHAPGISALCSAPLIKLSSPDSFTAWIIPFLSAFFPMPPSNVLQTLSPHFLMFYPFLILLLSAYLSSRRGLALCHSRTSSPLICPAPMSRRRCWPSRSKWRPGSGSAYTRTPQSLQHPLLASRSLRQRDIVPPVRDLARQMMNAEYSSAAFSLSTVQWLELRQ